MSYKIAVLKGDGIGPEVVDEALKVLNKVSKKLDLSFEYKYANIGGIAIDQDGEPLPQKTIDICKESDSVLLGAVGGTKWDNLPGEKRPEKGLLKIRKELNLYANLRPAKLYEALDSACPIKKEFRPNGIDIMVVRELTGGIYFGERGIKDTSAGKEAFDIETYNQMEIERIARTAFETALKRQKKLISVDKANVLESSRLWRSVVNNISQEYPEVEVEHMFVDNASMQLIRRPSNMDVIVTSNLFGDILSDEASMIVGSIGILPSASLNADGFGMYEPIHGSAPDIAGQNIANPLATILSVAMMLKYSLNLENASNIIEKAVNIVLDQGWRTKDTSTGAEIDKVLTCSQMGDKVCEILETIGI